MMKVRVTRTLVYEGDKESVDLILAQSWMNPRSAFGAPKFQIAELPRVYENLEGTDTDTETNRDGGSK